MNTNDTNPYRPPTSLPADSIPRIRQGASRHGRLVCVVECVIVVIAIIAEFWDIETIILSGLALVIVGLVLAGISMRHGDRPMALLGAFAVSFSFGVFLLIFFAQWSPAQAELPVRVLSCVFGCIVLPLAYFLLRRPLPTERNEVGDS